MGKWGRYNDGGWTHKGIGETKKGKDKHFQERKKEEGEFQRNFQDNPSRIYAYRIISSSLFKIILFMLKYTEKLL